MTLTLEDLRPLLEQFRGDGLMVTCYAELSPAPDLAAHWPAAFKAKAAAVKEMLADDVPAWRQFPGPGGCRRTARPPDGRFRCPSARSFRPSPWTFRSRTNS